MAKFNNQTSNKTVNKSGHVAYRMADKSKLITQVLTSFFNEKKFYGDNSKDMVETVKRVAKADPQFVSSLAVFARREFNMRSVSHILTAILANTPEGKPFVRKTVQGVALRGDDLTEIMAAYLANFKKPIPNSLKKGIADVLVTFDAYTLAKYKGDGHEVKMRDLICLCRPKPRTAGQAALFKKCIEGTLETPETWETQLSANGNNKETWEKLIDGGKVGYMALLRNLRNIMQAKPSNFKKVMDKLSNHDAVVRSRQLPFRFLSAYKTVCGLPGTNSAVLDALETALDASLENLPVIPGKTVIAIDVSGSMSHNISEKSDIRCCEIAMLIGMIANRLCESSAVYTFATAINTLSVPKRAGVLYASVHETRCSGGTDMGLPIQKMIRDKIEADRIIIISDNECNSGRSSYSHKTVQSLADEYRRSTGRDIWVHAIDLMGYGTQQFAGHNTNIIAGWSEKVFDFIMLAEQGEDNLEKTIAAYRW